MRTDNSIVLEPPRPYQVPRNDSIFRHILTITQMYLTSNSSFSDRACLVQRPQTDDLRSPNQDRYVLHAEKPFSDRQVLTKKLVQDESVHIPLLYERAFATCLNRLFRLSHTFDDSDYFKDIFIITGGDQHLYEWRGTQRNTTSQSR